MKIVQLREAQAALPQLLAAVEAGEDVIIVPPAGAAVRLVVATAPRPPRGEFGALAGQVVVTPAFFEPCPDAKSPSTATPRDTRESHRGEEERK